MQSVDDFLDSIIYVYRRLNQYHSHRFPDVISKQQLQQLECRIVTFYRRCNACGSRVRLYDGPDLKLCFLVGWDRSSLVCCLVYRGSTDGLLLLQIPSGVVWKSSDLQLSPSTLYLLSPCLCFSIVLNRNLLTNFIFCTTSETEGEIGAVKLSPQY